MFIILGSVLVFVGLLGLHQNILWLPGYSYRFATFKIPPTTDFLVFGGVFVVLGIVTTIVSR
jgi:hypothetical protein